jgi:hypothetical protein
VSGRGFFEPIDDFRVVGDEHECRVFFGQQNGALDIVCADGLLGAEDAFDAGAGE